MDTVRALDVADALIVMIDRDGTVAWVSGAFERVTGGADELAPGQPFAAFARQLGIERGRVDEALARARAWVVDARLRSSAGELRHVRVRVEPVRDADGSVLGALVTARDETELHRLRAVAEAVNLATNVGQMFAGIRHELGNPVNSLKTALTVLSGSWRGFEPSHVEHYFERMLVEVGRVEYLLRSLRSFSAFEDLQLRPMLVAPMLVEIMRVLQRPAAEREVEVRVDVAPELGVVADERALYQVLLNLLTNAMDAVSRGRGRVQVRARAVSPARAAIEVIDDGDGIPTDRLQAIRDPFFTTKPHGTGLGLTIVDRLVAEMDGELEIESRAGRTVMRVLLGGVDADA